MWIFIDTDWNKRFRRIESVWVDVLLQRCQSMILSKYCLDRSMRNFWDNFIWSTLLIWSIRRIEQSEHRRCQTEKICWMMRWDDIMISWDDEMNWWNSEPKNFSFEKRSFWSDDLIIWFDRWTLSHYIIIQFFMHKRLDHESHLLIWDDSNRQILHQYVDFESSHSTIIQSRWFIQVEMISFIFTDFRDRREINELEDEYAILMRSDRSDNEARKHLDQKKRASWRSKISILRRISMNHEMKNQ
jgi:hypothetical protein